MATVPYLVQIAQSDAQPYRSLRNGVSAMALNAESVADARAFAKSQFDGDVDAMWAAAAVTQVSPAANMAGWSFRLRIVNPDSGDSASAVVFDETVNASGLAAVAATGTLTGDGTVVSDGDTVVIDGKTYTFQATLTEADGHVHIVSGNAASTLTNLFHAINKSGGTAGTDYANAMTAHPTVTATNPSGTTVVVTAKTAGAAGNSIATTETSSHLSWGAADLAGGEDAGTGKISDFANAMVTALNATDFIAGASFNSGTHVLTVANSSDAIGDHRVFAYFIPPNADSSRLVGIPGFITAKADSGDAADALTVTVAADTYTIPNVVALLGPAVV